MSPEEKKVFRENLHLEIDHCTQSIEGLQEFLKPIAPNVAIGRLSRMEALSEKGIRVENLRTESQRLQQLKRALERLDEESFGRCANCNQAIPKQRLLAVPASRLCVQCLSNKPR